jgi:hypothetical protein
MQVLIRKKDRICRLYSPFSESHNTPSAWLYPESERAGSGKNAVEEQGLIHTSGITADLSETT